MYLGESVGLARRRWLAITLPTILGIVFAAGASYAATPSYQATTSIYFSLPYGNTASDLSQGATYTQNQMLSFAELASMPAVLDPVIKELGLNMRTKDLASQINASVQPDTVIIELQATSSSPQTAAMLANAVAAQLGSTVKALAPKGPASQPTIDASTVAAASPPAAPASPKTKRNLAAGLLAGLFLGVLLAAGRDRLDTRIRRAEDIPAMNASPVLGEIATDRDMSRSRLVVLDRETSPQSESFRRIRTNLRFLAFDNDPLLVGVTSTLPSEGKSTVAVNLALVLAQAQQRVLLIDADLRKPSVGEYLGLEQAAGLTTILIGRAAFSDVVQPWGNVSLDVLASGEVPPNPSELLGSRAMLRLLDEVKGLYDVVILDTAPLLPVADTALLAPSLSGVVIVANTRRVRRHEFVQAQDTLTKVGANALGVILNQVRGKTTEGYYGQVLQKQSMRRPWKSRERGSVGSSNATSRPRDHARQPELSASNERVLDAGTASRGTSGR
jgi:capsular exopolysaccharide synthesis family protein